MADKKVLVLYYSQSGQLTDIVKHFIAPFDKENVEVELVRIQPVNDFEFPWTSDRFFDAMPETVLEKPMALPPLQFRYKKYDLIVLAYQPWFLSLSLPFYSALQLESVKSILKNAPVVTLIGARNMWISSQERLKAILKEAGAHLVGNVALVDKHNNQVSVVTILYWMLTGKKDRYLGIFPKPGVSDKDILEAEIFGQTVLDFLLRNNWEGMQQQMIAQGAVDVQYNLMFVEERAPRLFKIWAKMIDGSPHRKTLLVVFKYYLLFAIFIVAPIVLTLNLLLFRIFFIRKARKKMEYYRGVS